MSDRGRHLTDGERDFFEKFFQRLDAATIPTVLLRNYDDFPTRIGHDLDVFFRRSDLAPAVKIFRETLATTSGEILHIQELDYVLAVWFRVSPDEPQPIHLDFFHGAFTWHGLAYLSEETLLAASRPKGRFKIPRPAHEALNLFLQSLLWGSFFKLRYRDRLRELLADPAEATAFWALLEDKFGANAKPPFDLLGKDDPSGQEQRHYAAKLRRALKWRSILRNPPGALFRLARHWRQEFATVLSPPGVHFAVLGPDGSGKSTVIAEVKTRLDDYFGEKVEGHWRPSVLPDIGVLLGQRKNSSGPTTDPHGKKLHSVPMSAFRLCYYWLDYWLGWPLRIRKPKAGNCLVIYDRYAMDMWCDQQRYRLNLPGSVLKFFCRLVPQPDFTFVLTADAKTIHARKGEVPLQTLEALLQRYNAAVKNFPRTRTVDCSRPAAQIADEITSVILEHLKVKAHRNHWVRDQ
jgi:thymidylate kinase